MVEVAPFAFMFDSSHALASASYGAAFDSDFLQALKNSDNDRTTTSLVLRGDILLHNLCYRPTRVSVKNRSNSRELSPDYDFYKLLIGEFWDALSTEDCTFRASDMINLFMNGHIIYSIVLPTLPTKHWRSIDKHLQGNSCFVGSTNLDLSNPLQSEMFERSLIRDAFIDEGKVHMELGVEGFLDGEFHGTEEFSDSGIVSLTQEEFATRAPAVGGTNSLSARAMVTVSRLRNRGQLNVHQKLANMVHSTEGRKAIASEYDWDLKQLPDAPEEVAVQARKLSEYLLNLSHEKGRGKAKFFDETLGIRANDWRFLQGQLIDALRDAIFENVQLSDHGIKFTALLAIKGRNGRVASVNTVWIVQPRERARLITAYPTNSDELRDVEIQEPLTVSAELKGQERWEAIFVMATKVGAQAAEKCVPTPMVISGGNIIMEGECGGAYVTVWDGRKGFARWLKVNGHGVRGPQGGVLFYSDVASQSVDRARAYAEAFAKVLRRNGIHCSINRYLT